MAKRELPDGMVKRGSTYHADFRAGGRRVRKRLSRNLTTAKQLLIELRARAERADFGLIDNNVEADKLRKQFLRHCRQTLAPGSVERYQHGLNAILPSMPARVSQVTPRAVVDYRERRLSEGKAATTINYEVLALGRMMNWAVKNRLIGENPIKGVGQLPEHDKKEGRALDRSEVDRLLAFSPPHWRDIWYCYLVTGMRNQELAHLRFEDVDWDARELVIRRGVAKNHKARRLPIDDGLWEILQNQYEERDQRQPGRAPNPKTSELVRARFTREHVFTTRQNSRLDGTNAIYVAFMKSCQRASIETKTVDDTGRVTEHVDVHSLRRTFATELIVSGTDPKTVQELLGHATLEMTMNLYAKIRTTTKRQAVAGLPYGGGARPPEHLIEVPTREKPGHILSTMGTKAADGAS